MFGLWGEVGRGEERFQRERASTIEVPVSVREFIMEQKKSEGS